MEERSASSDHGRRWEKPWRREEERRERKARNAGVAIGGWDAAPVAAALVDWELEMGSVGGDDMVARESPIVARGMGRRRRNKRETIGDSLFGFGLLGFWEKVRCC